MNTPTEGAALAGFRARWEPTKGSQRGVACGWYVSGFVDGRNAVQTIDGARVDEALQLLALRDLWAGWLEGMYDGPDLLRRVRLAVYGPLSAPTSAAGANATKGPKRSATPPDPLV